MGLTAIAQQAAEVAFEAAGDALEDAVVHLPTTQTYDYDTDTMVESGGGDVTVKGFFYEERVVQNNVILRQTVLLLKGKDVPTGVAENNTVTRTKTGELWQIAEVDPQPTGAIVLLRLRR